jgi:hypothetical protein
MRKTINPLFFFYFNPTISPPLRIYPILSALLDGEISILVAFATKIVKPHP